MADPLPRSETFWLLAGVGIIGVVIYLANRQQGLTLQATAPAATSTQAQSAPIATNSLAADMTALSDPLLSVPSGAFGGSMTAPGQYVQLPSGGIVPFMQGIAYGAGSIIHYGDGSVQVM